MKVLVAERASRAWTQVTTKALLGLNGRGLKIVFFSKFIHNLKLVQFRQFVLKQPTFCQVLESSRTLQQHLY